MNNIKTALISVWDKTGIVDLASFLDKNNVIYHKQFGFRRRHSTIHALNTAVTQIANSLNQNDVVFWSILRL